MIKKIWVVFSLCLVLFPALVATNVHGAEVHGVETQGNIGFTGSYQPIGTPDPAPPESVVRPPITEIAKPGGSLPQTNTIEQSWLVWLGGLVLLIIGILWKRKRESEQN
ncbi:LPXTG cell wall anchor domain-containing protein [Enterococcus sp. DIV0840c]|uniref:LPXTG cell wall anchor domain-containing protein n=1 Tax=Enterococcus sp. DIV0840c TaxID=2774772 RepID=UPI003D2E0F24